MPGDTDPPPRQAHAPVPSATRVINLPIQGVMPYRTTRTLPRSDAARNVEALLALFGSDIRRMGGGAYASVYRIAPTPRAFQALEKLRATVSNAITGPLPPSPDRSIILKVGIPDNGEAWPAFLKRSVRENAAHVVVQRAAPHYVPALYVAGSMGRAYVAAMEDIPGETLASYIATHGGITRDIYAHLQRAVVASLSAGIVHGDLHDANVMVLPDGTIRILDFGFAVQLSPQQRAAVAQLVRTDTNAAWNAIGGYVNAVQAQRIRGLAWYNPEVKALRVWRGLILDAYKSPTNVVAGFGSGLSSGSSGRSRPGSMSVRRGLPSRDLAMKRRRVSPLRSPSRSSRYMTRARALQEILARKA
jgi:serine/threonine protein kinase